MRNAIVIGILIGVGWYWLQPRGTPFDGTREENLQVLEEIAVELNEGLPKRIDAWTTALSIDVTDAGIVNRYRLNVDDLSRLTDIWEHLRDTACEIRGYRFAMAAGFSITYSYENRQGSPLGNFEVREEHCLEAESGAG